MNLRSLNSPSKDPAGYRLKSNQRLKKAAAGIAKKRKIDIAYSEASATYHEKGIGNIGYKKGRSLTSFCKEIGDKYGVLISPSTVSKMS